MEILFSINGCALTNYFYKDFIKEMYNHNYQSSHLNIKNLNSGKTKKHTNVLIISNFYLFQNKIFKIMIKTLNS